MNDLVYKQCYRPALNNQEVFTVNRVLNYGIIVILELLTQGGVGGGVGE